MVIGGEQVPIYQQLGMHKSVGWIESVPGPFTVVVRDARKKQPDLDTEVALYVDGAEYALL